MQETINATAIQQPVPIVQESDFPQQTSQFQELMSRYRAQNQLPATDSSKQTVRENPLANVEILNEVGIKTFSDLAPEEQQSVRSRINGINYLKAIDIQTFGSSRQSPVTKHAEIIIGRYSASEVGEISNPITKLLSILKSNNPKEIAREVSVDSDRDWGFFSSLGKIISMKNMKKRMFDSLAQYDTIIKNIQVIEVELQKQQLSLHRDIAIYQEMSKATAVQVDDFELDYIALQLMKDNAESRLKALTSKGKLNFMEMNEANDLQAAIDRISRRMYTIQTIRLSAIQSISQIHMLIYGDEIICEKIDEVSSLVIPLWTWQYAIAIATLKQQEALNIQKTIRGITSKLLTGSSKLLHDNMIAAQEELYAAAIAIKEFSIVQEYIDDMITNVNKSRQKVSQKCIEGVKTMQSIEQKNFEVIPQSL